MAVHYDHIGTNEDGTPRFHIWSDSPDAHLVMTGPIVGNVEVDGQLVDVSAPFIEVDSPETALKVSDAIGERHVREGHPDFVKDPDLDSLGFVHQRSDGVVLVNAAAAPETLTAVDRLDVDVVKVEA
jgi:hypothetical protein